MNVQLEIEGRIASFRLRRENEGGDWKTLAAEASSTATRALLYKSINGRMLIDAAALATVAAERAEAEHQRLRESA